MLGERKPCSSEKRAGLKSPLFLLLALGDLLELALNFAGSSKSPTIQFLEGFVRRIEDETACQPYGNADRPAFQFDCKSLHAHSIFS